MKYNIHNEYINIDNYSPFWHVNEVSEEYQKTPFLLPIVNISEKSVPVHPDTFNDLLLNEKSIVRKVKVYPTSSYRTVYEENENVFIKLTLLRNITRGLRNLPNKELDRSIEAGKILEKIQIDRFYYLKEEPHYGEEEVFNYIVRKIEYPDMMPLFYVIKSRYFSKETIQELIKIITDILLQFISKGIYLEFHTQNILVDDLLNIYYRDLSDVRSTKNETLFPSYYASSTIGEVNSLCFDKTFCSQNLDHIFRYYTDITKAETKEYIRHLIQRYNIEFPNYSVAFPTDSTERKLVKIELNNYRA